LFLLEGLGAKEHAARTPEERGVGRNEQDALALWARGLVLGAAVPGAAAAAAAASM
jgi:hypothetical protein